MNRLMISVLLALLLLAGCGGGTSSSSSGGSGRGLSCSSEQETISDIGYTAIGVTYSDNVQATLTNARGVTIRPARTETGTTSNGIDYASDIYGTALPAGRYTVEVSSQGELLESYTISIQTGDSKMLTVLCR